MPRIDPLQLLKCLSVLLTPEGGILSREEVPRLVNLMTKFSKKLVSKCVYVLILKSTDTELVDMFMGEGGWTLIQTWLQDAVQTGNWDLVREILGLLLITPVDVERLKLNILPKLIKSLSRREELEGVAKLSTQLVQQWLAIVKGSSSAAMQQQQTQPVQPPQAKAVTSEPEPAEVNQQSTEDKENVVEKPSENSNAETISTAADDGPEEGVAGEVTEDAKVEEGEKSKEEEKKGDEKEVKSRSSKSSSKSGKERDREKDRKKSSSSSSKSGSSSKSKSSSSSRDKDRKDRDKDKDRRRSSSSKSEKSSSKSSGKERRDSKEKDKDKDKEKHPEKEKEKQEEKDKDTLAKIKPQSIEKLGRIPKKPNGPTPEEKEIKESKEIKKKSFSVGIRKDSEERPKTVKVFNSKMRSTGLEEEIKPAPPRPVKKPTPTVQLPTIPPKRPSPPREHRDPVLPPEKKLKIDKVDVPERPGAIKLIPPKPKPPVLQESDLFMDALTASATTKKEPKKRKRRASVTKESPPSPSSSPAREQPQTPTSPSQTTPNSPSLGLKSIAPINFYQDTLKTEENAENAENPENENKENAVENNVEVKEKAGEEDKETPASPMTPTDDTNGEELVEPKRPKLEGGLRGVLLYSKKKGPKRSISWKNESDLVEIRFFELDETERVNVTKTFGDMAKMEMTSEREALQMSRKVVGEDTMEAQIPWRLPFLIDQADPLAVPGHKSLEKDIQFAREKSVLQALYFDKRRVPDSPEEPIPENHQMSDPIVIPLEDPETQEIDLRNTPWPEPKGSPPHVEPQIPPHIFPNVPGPFNHPFNNMPPPQFQGMPPRFPPQAGPGNPGPMGPGSFMPPMMPNGNILGPPNLVPPNEMMNQGPMNQNMFPPGPVHDGFGPGPDFPMFNQNNMPNNNMNMFPPNNFNNHRPNNRGGFRRGGGNSGNWVRMSGPGNWKRGGGGHRGGRLCKNVQNHGYCRNRDNCPFVHP
ncbi:serine/threonine-protein phosphatase 1 regulatory subunit 10 isoform X2 [Anoplophora glabripennis]|uniref:serine/threonine-protein phosphatase 1 regulatory subunit 10 isoform X2 n=1 Tax=Anoplophora glabripennis TaxID=217634 RepID=UPI0008747F3D|nr:serine/threonine-protein phosphatase 1 regulatory subunit 10 isoform X2 [Anoplophora glabripennis]